VNWALRAEIAFILDTPEEIHAYRKVPLPPANGVRIRDDIGNSIAA